jgi:hypothetical protein
MAQHLVNYKCSAFGGMVMNSPVDGADPFGINDGEEFFVTPELGSRDKIEVVLPALIIKGTLDPIASLGVPCAPPDMSNERFYEAWQGPSWFLKVEGVGHLDMCSDVSGYEGTCGSSDNSALNAAFQVLSAGKMAAFINLLVRKDASGLTFLNSKGGVPGVSYQTESQNTEDGVAFGCEYSPYFAYLIEVIVGASVAVVLLAGFAYMKFYKRRTSDDDDDDGDKRVGAEIRPAQSLAKKAGDGVFNYDI